MPEPQARNYIKKETLVQLFSCKFCEISKNNFFAAHLRTTASKFATEMLIFRSSRSQMFFKIGVLKSFAILRPLSDNKVAGLLLTPTLATYEFLLQQFFFAAEDGTYC